MDTRINWMTGLNMSGNSIIHSFGFFHVMQHHFAVVECVLAKSVTEKNQDWQVRVQNLSTKVSILSD
jgi:hypothetical protein